MCICWMLRLQHKSSDPEGVATNADGSPRLKLLWDSTMAGSTFNFSKFCPPMVADGKLYIATYDGRVDVYALKP